MKRLGIVFCGGCNPQYERGMLANAVLEALGADCDIVYNTTDCERVLYLSGCSSNCAYKYNICDKPSVVVAGLRVDAELSNAGELLATVIKKLDGLDRK